MKILAITACTADIAYTHITKEKLESVTRELGSSVKVEIQGSIGVEDELTPKEVRDADMVLISVDIRVNKEWFKGEPVVEVPIDTVMKSPKGVISRIHEKLSK